MNKVIRILILLILCKQATAQQIYNTNNLEVSQFELKNNRYTKDSTANAYFIYEKGYSRLENGGDYNILHDYEAKIKIINREGFDYASIEIFLYKDNNRKERFRNLSAYTHNMVDGKVIKTPVKKENIFKEAYSEKYDIIKFTFPKVEPGSVITYKYQLESPFVFKFIGWDFQDDIPKVFSKYITDIPGNYLYHTKLNGTLKLDTNTSEIKKNCLQAGGGQADCSHSVYMMKDIPAFREEKYMTAKKNYFSRIEYELSEFKGFDGRIKKYTKTWKNVDYKMKKEGNICLLYTSPSPRDA